MMYADNCCTYTETHNPHKYIYRGPCIKTGEEVVVEVPAEELWAYRQGAKAQDAFVSLSADEREFLMSGISAGAWKAIFGE